MSDIDWENDMQVVKIKREDQIVEKYTEHLQEKEDKNGFEPVIRKRSYVRKKMVFKLKVTGMSYEDIATEVRRIYREEKGLNPEHLPNNYNAEKASQDVSNYLEKYRGDLMESAREMVMVEVERINKMIEALWDRVRKVDGKPAELKAIDRIIKLQNRKAEFLGLDSPEQLELADRTQEGFSFGWADPDEAPKFNTNNESEDNDSN